MHNETCLDSVADFKKYLEKDFRPAYYEIGRLDDKNRIHIQKSLYISLLNRFDSTLDDFFKSNSNLEIDDRSATIKADLEAPVTTKMLKSTLKEGVGYLEDKRRVAFMGDAARRKHVDKARLMLKTIGFNDKGLNNNRVNNLTGGIFNSFETTSSNAPSSIIGFIDWLYCRRNVLVHSGGRSAFDKSVVDRFQKDYKVKLTTIRISYGALSIADKFYSDLLKLPA